MDGKWRRGLHRLAEFTGIAALVRHFHQQHEGHKDGHRIGRILYRIRHARIYPVAVAILAMVSAGTGLYPFGPVIVAATVFAVERWRSVYLSSCLGAAFGAALCALVIQTVGIGIVDTAFPEIRQNAYWERSAYWIGQHGALALTVIAALPVPQMPALIVSALGQLHPVAIAIALFFGKVLKYGVYVGAVRLVMASMHHVRHDPPDPDPPPG